MLVISKSPEKYTYSGQLRSELAQLWRKSHRGEEQIAETNKKKTLKICPASSTATVGLRIPDWLKEVRWPPGEVRKVPPWRWGWQYEVSVTVRRYMPWYSLITLVTCSHADTLRCCLYNITFQVPLLMQLTNTDASDTAPAPRWEKKLYKNVKLHLLPWMFLNITESLGVTIFLNVFLFFFSSIIFLLSMHLLRKN